MLKPPSNAEGAFLKTMMRGQAEASQEASQDIIINPDVVYYYSRILCHFCHEMMGPVRKCMGISQIRRE